MNVFGFALILSALLGLPLFALFAGLALLLFQNANINSAAVIIEFYRLANTPMLVAIPLFTFAGYLLAYSDAPKRLIQFSQTWIGWLPGGLAFVTILTCAVFTAFTGASGVTIIALGGLLLPMLLQDQYKEKFSIGLITSTGSIGLLFPPSLPVILYGIVGKTSVDQLFIAGILPGILLITLIAIYSVNTSRNIQTYQFEWNKALTALKLAKWELPLPIIVLVGIYGGFFTVTEAAAITAAYVFVVEVWVHKEIQLVKDVPRIAKESMVLVGGILIILGSALGFTNYLIDEQVPNKIFEWMKPIIQNKWLFLLILNLFLIIVGMLMDIFSAIVVVVPLIIPIAQQFQIDPIHLGIIFLTNLEIGYLTPPVGLNLFMASFRFQKPLLNLYTSTFPFLILMIIALMMITYIPALSLVLVRWFQPQSVPLQF
ncbi:MAG: TRAP transporter large permease subunit [bacterium]|nr:TRAP transporter large permease subunit [bacterium]